MNITLNFEKSSTDDLSIMVDVLRASTTINIALDKFKGIIPTDTPEKAFEISKEKDSLLAGERSGTKIKGFNFGNSPYLMSQLDNSKYSNKYLILTTTNGTRIMKNMNSKILIGSFINAKYVAKAALNNADNDISIVMAGIKGNFAIEDYLGAGEILKWIAYYLKNGTDSVESSNEEEICDLVNDKEIIDNFDEFSRSAMLSSMDKSQVRNYILFSRSANRLISLGYIEDVDISLSKNITNNVAIYKNGTLKHCKS